jgi:YfiH family protein
MLQFKIFGKNVIQGVSDSSFGSINPKLNKSLSEKRAIRFLKSLGYQKIFAKNLVWKQGFNSEVHICNLKDSGKIIKKAESLISNLPGQILVTLVADCLPILFYEKKNQVVAAVHGARRCLIEGIIEKTIKKMISNFNCQPKNILVGIGPHIRKCCYYLLPKTYQNLKKTKFKKYFEKKEGKTYFDLTKLALDKLKKAGILKKNIEDCQICSFCNFEEYFSARKEKEKPGIYKEKNSRFGAFIGCK